MARYDEAAFAAFHAATARALRTYVYRVTGDASDADDIVQEAFLRVLRADIDWEDDEYPRRYLYRVASNLVVDRWRTRKRERDATSQSLSPFERLTAASDADVERTFFELGERDRALLWMAYVEGNSHEEIAASLRVARRSVKVMLFRARRRLRDLLRIRGVVERS